MQAIHHSSQLLTDDCSPNIKLYAHLYTADALCHLNRSAEAVDHLAQAMQLGEVNHPLNLVPLLASSLPHISFPALPLSPICSLPPETLPL